MSIDKSTYKKPGWRKSNLPFLERCFPRGLPGSYVELVGTYTENTSKEEMFYLLKSNKLITKNEQFIGVDEKEVVLLKRVRKDPFAKLHPLIFGDIFTTIGNVQRSGGVFVDTKNRKVSVDSRVVAVNFDFGDNNPDGPFLRKFAPSLRIIAKNSWSYTNKLAIIITFTRDRGSRKGTVIEDRKTTLAQSFPKVFGVSTHGSVADIIKSFEDYVCPGRTLVTTTVRFILQPNSIRFANPDGSLV